MSDPVGDVMQKLAKKGAKGDAADVAPEVLAKAFDLPAAKVKKEKLFNNKYYRTVNIDVTAEEQKALQAQAKLQKAVAQKKKEEEEDAKKLEMKKMLQGMGFDVK